MNHIYRSIWNQATGAYAAVSENVKSAGKRSLPGASGGGAHFALTSMAAALMLGYGSLALAGPTGANVVAGQATINGAPGSTVINQGSQNAVINWASFNIGQGESVQFKQPNSNAVALNRVLGSDGTSILGNLSANGKVFIVNPNGILFGQGASVNTAGLVASTLDISNSDFMSGKYQFKGNGAGKVLNQGSISAPGGYVALLGANVSNQGTIQARLGSVALAAGKVITLDVAGDGLLNVAINEGAVGALVNNGGLIKADGGSVLLSAQAAGDLLKTVVNNTGVIEAQTIDTRGGTIKLLGDMQSGTVNAAGTLDASAPDGGRGGFIDTSAAHVKIADTLKVTTAAAKGLAGTWLIDPADFNIAARGGDMTGSFLSNSLKSGNVQIQSISGSGGTQGNINVNDTIVWSANKLTLTAQNNININTAMRGSGTASLALEYGQSSAAGTGAAYNVKAEVDLPSGNNFSTRQGTGGTVVVYKVINDLGAPNSVTANDLQGINGGLNGNYVLGSNIDATATSTALWNGSAGFLPIGSDSARFTGKFDGLGHVVNNLKINRTETDVGLFGSIGSAGSVSNLGLVGANITGAAGAYLGAGVLAGTSYGQISNSYVSGSVSASSLLTVGGLVGRNFGGISNSRSSASVVSAGFYGGGGLVGTNAANAVVSNSFATGTVTSDATGSAGGLVGFNYGNVSSSFATGAVAGGQRAGGLVAYNRYNTIGAQGSIDRSYATGAVTGHSQVGGLVGHNEEGTISNSYSTSAVTATVGQAGSNLSGDKVGGLVGFNQSGGAVSNSYATGNVSGVANVGGVLGWNDNSSGGSGSGRSTLTNVYSSGTVTGSSNVGGVVGQNSAPNGVVNGIYNTTINTAPAIGLSNNGGTATTTGLSSTQMKTASSFAGFNFVTTGGVSGNNWVMVNTNGTFNSATGTGATLPMLSSEWSTTVTSAHQLQLMGLNLTAQYVMANDINAARTASSTLDVWTTGTFIPVGTGNTASTATHFNGALDGGFHVITGLTLNRAGQTYNGLFGTLGVSGVVKSLGMEGGSVAGGPDTGVIAGDSFGTISNVYSTVAVSGNQRTGGLVGAILAGSVSDSYAAGSVAGSSPIVGGLAGRNDGAIINSYATGAVSGIASTGGLAGSGAGTVSNSFWDRTTTNQNTSAGGLGIGLTTAQMKTLANFNSATTANGSVNPNWELANTWVVYDGNSYPLLRGFMKQLTVKVSSATKTYDGQAYNGAGSAVYSNLTDSDLQGTLVVGAAGGAVNAGNYAISGSGLYSSSGQHGYSITYLDGALTVNQLAIALNGAAVGNKTYDGTTDAIVRGNLTGVLAGDIGNVTFSGTGSYANKNAGNNKVVTANATLGGSAGGNYTLAPISGLTGNIGKATITSVSGILVNNKVYDGTVVASLNSTDASFGGMVGGDSLTVSTVSGNFSDKNAGNGKTVNISGLALGGSDVGNYVLASSTASTTGNISKATIASVSGLLAGNKVYDGSTAASLNLAGASFSGMVGGDNLTVSNAAGSFTDKNAGNGKTVNISGITLSGIDAGNYNLASATSSTTANISKATVSSVSGILAGNKVYDGTVAASLDAAGASFSGMVDGDNLTVSSASGSFSDKKAGNGKTVNISGLALGGTDAGNYNLSNTTASSTADISKASITGVSGLVAGNKVYDGRTAASLNTAGASFAGMVGGDNLTLSNAAGSFSDKNAANGKTVNISGLTLGGADAGNYNLTATTSSTTANISKASIASVSGIAADNKVYDGGVNASLNTAGASFSGLVGGDNLTVSNASGSFSDKNAGSGKTVSISSIALGGADAGNYNLTTTTSSSTADISKATISSVNGLVAGNKVYDGTLGASLNVAGASFTGMVGGDNLTVSNASGSFSDKNAGNGKTVNISGIVLGGSDAGNYNLPSDTASSTANISAKALTLSGLSGNKVYDGTVNAALAGGTLNGLVGTETLSFAAQGSYSDKNVGTNKAISVTGATLNNGTGLASNYTLAAPAGASGDITKATISNVTGLTALDKLYNGSLDVSLGHASAVINGKVDGDDVQFSGASGAFTDKNVGINKSVNISGITLSGSDLGNYNFIDNTATATASISPKAVTLSGLTAGNKVYDGTTAAVLSGGNLIGVVSGETLSFSGGVATFSDKNAGVGKVVMISGTVLQDGTGLASNYSFTSPANLTADISKATISSVANLAVDNKVYDGTAYATVHAQGVTFNGILGSDSLSVTAASAAFNSKDAGNNKAVTISGLALSGTDAGNYNLATSTGSSTANITPKALIVVGQVANNKVYDGNTVAQIIGGSLSGLVGSETLSIGGQTANFSDQNAGNAKAVTVSGTTLLDSTGAASNYTVSDPTGLTASITPKALIVVGQVAGNKVYDGNAVAQIIGGSLSGLVGSETLVIAGQTAAFSDQNAANAKTVTVSGTTLLDGSGSASNYTVSNPTGLTASITPKALIVVGQVAGNKVYDGNTVAQLIGGSLSGLVGSETLAIGGQTASFSDKNAGIAKTVTVSGTTLLDGSGSASNYTVSDPSGLTASITPKALTVVGQVAGNKVYDGNTAARLIGGSLLGLVGSETLAIGGQTAAFSDKNAANAKTVTVSGTTLLDAGSGTTAGSASNYTVTNPTGLTASITPASISGISGIVAANKVYDGSTAASVNLAGASFNGMVAGDALNLTGVSVVGAFSDKNAASGKTVTISGLGLSGADAGNYVLASKQASTTASISQAALTVKVDNAEKDQGRVNPAFSAAYSGLVAGDTLANEVSGNLVFSTPATTGSPAGNYLVSASGQASNNYALNYVGGVLKVNPTEALQSAIANVIASIAVAPSQGNMVQADMVVSGDTGPAATGATAEAHADSNAPVVQLSGNVISNVLPGLRLSVVDTGLRLPVDVAGGTRQEGQ